MEITIRRASACPDSCGRPAFPFVGFTGGALWIEPDAGRAAILLASRDSMSVDLGPWRGRLQELTDRA